MNIIGTLVNRFPLEPILPGRPLGELLLKALLKERQSRLAHSLGVARMARDLAKCFDDEPFLETAALFHEVGCSPLLNVTGFQPLDGAIFLAHRGADERIVTAVLCHTSAPIMAASHPEAASFYAELKIDLKQPLTDLVTFCDIHTSPSGRVVTLAETASEVADRISPDHLMLKSMTEYCMDVRDQVLSAVASRAPHNLPWLFLDVDSTLCMPGERLSTRNRDALRAYVSAEGKLSLATGRHPDAIMSLVKDAGLPGSHIAGNGAVIINDGQYDLIDGISAYIHTLDEYLRCEKIPFVIYTPSGLFITSPDVDDTHLRLLMEIDEPTPDRSHEPDWDNAFKILMFVSKEEKELESSLRKWAAENGVACVRTAREFLELISHRGGKAMAMEKLVLDAGWPIFHTSAIGDSENDLCLLRRSGFSAVVGNASRHLKAVADRVIPTCADDGVAAYLEELLL